MFVEAQQNQVSAVDNAQKRIQALSPAQQQLLALRLGVNLAPQQPKTSRLVAFVTTNAATDETNLLADIGQQLPRYMIPQDIVTVESFQRTPNGKVDRTALKKLAQNQTAPSQVGHHTTDLDETEKAIAAIWRDLLNAKSIDPDANFFDIGGHSLLAVRMLAQVQAELGTTLPISIVLEAPTVRSLAAHCRDEKTTAQSKLRINIQLDGEATPLYCLPIPGLGVTVYRHLAPAFAGQRPIYGFDIPPEYDPFMPIEELATFFVDELLNTQPQGPYYLSGSSVGGLIAFEVGRQLHQRGIEDVVVILFDTFCPTVTRTKGKVKKIRTWLNSNWQSIRRHDINTLHHLDDVRWQLSKITRDKLRSSAARTAKRLGIQAQFREDYESRSNRHKKYREVEQTFTPHPYSGDMLLYKATLVSFSGIQSTTLGWEAYTERDIQVEHIRGDHSGILQERYANGLAQRMLENLTAFDRHYQATS